MEEDFENPQSHFGDYQKRKQAHYERTQKQNFPDQTTERILLYGGFDG